MGLRVVASRSAGLAVEAPVALNHNHLQTAFGGSINAIATLAGYGLLWLETNQLGAHLVVAQSSIRYLRPVRETIRAVCTAPSAEDLTSFKETVRAKGAARIWLHVVVEEHERSAAEFDGLFVARRSVDG